MIRAALACLLLSALPLWAQNDPALAAARASVMLTQAAADLERAEQAQDRAAALTEVTRAYEDGLAALREGLRRAAQAEARLTQALAREQEDLATLLVALQSIERAPPPLLLFHPDGPLGAARSGMILSDLTPALVAEANALRARLTELAALRDVQQSAQEDLSAARTGIQAARIALTQAMADRVGLPDPVASDTEAMRALIAASDSLDSFAAALNEQREAQPIPPRLERLDGARGALPLPARGEVTLRFGVSDAAGIARPGWVLATAPRALVTAPFTGTVRYAGPLLDLGNVVLLETDPQYLIILAGLDVVYPQTGEIVVQNSALGLMPQAPGTASVDGENGNLIITNAQVPGTSLSETLYIELREGNTPVDPALWFRTDRDDEE